MALSAPAAAQQPVVVGGEGLPPVEVNLGVLDLLGPGAAPLQSPPLPGAQRGAPVQLRPPGQAPRAPVPALQPAPQPALAAPAVPQPAAPPRAAPAPELPVLVIPPAPAPGEVPALAAPAAPAAPAPAPAPPPPPPAARPDLAPPQVVALPGFDLPAEGGALAVVEFNGAETELSPAAADILRGIADSITVADRRIQLNAYAGGSPETVAAARRLSLSRALTVRSFLIEQGVRSTRIDVRALGVPEEGDEAPPERVDILLLAER